jgi:hypothetical protein
LGLVLASASFLRVYFPGQQLGLALTLASGIGIETLQLEIDAVEELAIRERTPTREQRQFLRDLYGCFARGARLTIVTRQSAGMMERYLEGSGAPLWTAPRIFLGSRPVRERMQTMRATARQRLARGQRSVALTSPRFYMGDPEFFDAFVGLYFGGLELHAQRDERGTMQLRWRADMPWKWPSYAEILERYGSYHAQNFPLPSARSLLVDPTYELTLDDGLGGYLETVGLAKSFLAYSTWEEEVAE